MEQMSMMQKIEQMHMEKFMAGGGAVPFTLGTAQPGDGKQQSMRGGHGAGEGLGWPISPREQQSLTIRPKDQTATASGTSTSKSTIFCCISPPHGIIGDDAGSGDSSSKAPGDQASRFSWGRGARRKGVDHWATADAAEMDSLSPRSPLMIIAGEDISCEEAADREMLESQDSFFATE